MKKNPYKVIIYKSIRNDGTCFFIARVYIERVVNFVIWSFKYWQEYLYVELRDDFRDPFKKLVPNDFRITFKNHSEVRFSTSYHNENSVQVKLSSLADALLDREHLEKQHQYDLYLDDTIIEVQTIEFTYNQKEYEQDHTSV